jgi:hypothetical protein
MATSERTVGETLNTWVQTIAIVVAGVWAAYTFEFKEILAPAAAPVNISLNVQLKKIGPRNASNDLIAVELQTGATNPSSRDVYLLKSAWLATGCNIGVPAQEPAFAAQAEHALNSPQDGFADQFASPASCSAVAAGHLYRDYVLRPNESIRRTIIFYIPPAKYDELKVQVRMPTTDTRDKVDVDWKLEKDDLQGLLYRIGPNGEHTPFERGADGYSQKELREFGIQQARSYATMSLWQ